MRFLYIVVIVAFASCKRKEEISQNISQKTLEVKSVDRLENEHSQLMKSARTAKREDNLRDVIIKGDVEEIKAIFDAMLLDNEDVALKVLLSLNVDVSSAAALPILTESLIDHFNKGDLEASFDKLKMLESMPEVFSVAGNRLFSALQEKDPETAFAWMKKQNDHPLALMVAERFGVTLAGSGNVAQQAEELVHLTNSQTRDRLLGSLLETWTAESPEAALDFMEKFPDQVVFDAAIKTYVMRNAEGEPSTAMIWAEAITSKDNRSEAMLNTARIWKFRDPNTFQEWLSENAAKYPELSESLNHVE